MNGTLKATAALDALALALVFHQTGVDQRLGAYAAGLGLFDLNLLLVIFLARRLFQAAHPADAEAYKKTNPWLVLALLVKATVLGAGAYVGSGSVISKDVPDDALVVERSPVSLRDGWARRFRDMKMLNRKPKGSK